MSQSWFISGANRGIGLALVKIVASRPNTVVFAGARTPDKAVQLNEFAETHPNVHTVKLESTSAEDAKAAAKLVEAVAGGLDVVIANAGIAKTSKPLDEDGTEDFVEHFQVNTVGTLRLFQALYPLLLKRHTRKFITISTLAGSIAVRFPLPLTAYGVSKAALNYLTVRLHTDYNEKDGLIAIPIHPGTVDTDMGLSAAALFGKTSFGLSPEHSAEGVLKVVDTATTEQSGRFWSYDGSELAW
jgi:NAD(P)-dependent dehydrogenase (short-subunit alcohol dehydrogenase family)